MTDRVKLATAALVTAIVLWCVAETQAAQGKLIIEDNSGPWILIAAVITTLGAVAGPLLVRARKGRKNVR